MKQTFLPALGFVISCVPSWGQLLVDSPWLSDHMNDRELVIIHVGEAPGYQKGHIAGARNLSVSDVSKPNNADRNLTPQAVMASPGLLFEVASPDAIRDKLQSLGVSNSSHIVLYLGGDGPVPAVTRVAHVLNYVGLGDRTSILNGGIAAWTRAGYPLSTAVTADRPGRLTVRVKESLFADAELVKNARNSGLKLIDARAPANYRGIEPTFGKAGHIPGALNIPFNDLTDDAQLFQKDQIAARFQQAGIKSGDKVLVYCHIGMQATAVIFGARMLGIEAALYDGSFQDWAINNRGPVEK
jgi:thiosulfate/3-mercaptopyruvate sulfurtransferase